MNYIVATIKPWNIKVYNEIIKHYEGNWTLITDLVELTVDKIKKLNPKYIFFPHWSWKVPKEIHTRYNCIVFHPAPLPKGRGGSIIQHWIKKGIYYTQITAFKMTEKFDTGDILLQSPLYLYGSLEEIYIREAEIISGMIKEILKEDYILTPQSGESSYYYRRTPEESEIKVNTLKELFDHIRMLDAETYPKAFLESGDFRFEFSRPSLKTDEIIADVRITIKGKVK